jgi:hypothetical protein
VEAIMATAAAKIEPADAPTALEKFETEAKRAEREYARLAQEARASAAKLMRAAGTPQHRRTVDAWVKAQKKADPKIELVSVIVPKDFQHRHDDGELIDVSAGAHAVPRALAAHWWFRANGVKPADAP